MKTVNDANQINGSMLRKLLERDMERLAGIMYFMRGEEYFEQGRVQLIETGNEVTAEVQGTSDYEVRLWVEGEQIAYECDCPIGQEGEFCKHCVATGLAFLANPPETKRSGYREEIREYLETLDEGKLIEILLDACKQEKHLREKLLLQSRARGKTGAAVKAWKAAFDRATVTRGFVDYRDMGSFALGIEQVLDALGEWTASGRAAQVIELAEYAARKVANLVNECDDSNGELGALLARIGELHLAACHEAHPDPKELAMKLLDHELHDEFETFGPVLTRYMDVLGQDGLDEYRRLAEIEWAKIPALMPREKESGAIDRYRITRIMVKLAKLTGDLAAIIEVMTRDLSSEWTFLQIAQTCRDAGQPDLALQWAEKGLAAFPIHTDRRLLQFLIMEYQNHDLLDKAILFAWVLFEENPYLANYAKLNEVSARLGNWPEYREKALAHLRSTIVADFEKGKIGYARKTAPDQSPLIEILLWEEIAEEAWREAQSGFCDDGLLLKLAELRAQEHPEDSISVYRRMIASLVQNTNNRSYGEAMVLVRKIRLLLIRCKGEFGMRQYLVELRTNFKQKRNFMKLLDNL